MLVETERSLVFGGGMENLKAGGLLEVEVFFVCVERSEREQLSSLKNLESFDFLWLMCLLTFVSLLFLEKGFFLQGVSGMEEAAAEAEKKAEGFVSMLEEEVVEEELLKLLLLLWSFRLERRPEDWKADWRGLAVL